MRRAIAGVTLGLLLASAATAAAQMYAAQSLERDFRVDWEVTRDRKGPAVEGYLYNTAHQAAYRVRLQIERVDGAGAVVGNSSLWLLGTVGINDRAYFRSPVAEAAGYRVRVLSFDWVCDDGGS